MKNKARKLAVYTGKGVGVFDLSGRPGMYTEPQAVTIVMHDQEDHEPVFTRSEIEKLILTLRMAFNVIDEMNAEGFGPLTSKEGLEAFCALSDALKVFDSIQ